jgi:hypothetical protein
MRSIVNLIWDADVDTLRNIRVRKLVRKLNKARKAQSRKIDILCNDMIAAHRRSLDQLGKLCGAVEFYESILPLTDTDALLERTSDFITDCLGRVNTGIWTSGSFRLHTIACDDVDQSVAKQIEAWFNADLLDHVCGSNSCQSLADLLKAGMQANPMLVKAINAAVIPLGGQRGFILVWRSADNPFTADEIKTVCGIVPGLRKALLACQPLIPSST